MDLLVVTVPDCPNVHLLEVRLAVVLAELDAAGRVSIARRTVADTEQAARWQLRGSPTLLVDGVDPFAEPSVPCGFSCRIYRDERGRPQGAPSVTQLRRVLGQALAGEVPVWADALGRAGAGRVAPVEGGLRAVQQLVLRAFACGGRPPGPDELAETAQAYGVSAERVLAELDAADFLRLDEAGMIRAAYPFSAVPTPHRVEIAEGPQVLAEGARVFAEGQQVYAMCAVDALGMAAMLGRDVRITSADPVDGRPVTVEVAASGLARWAPAGAVVLAGQLNRCARGPAVDVCCSYVNFFADTGSARSWAESHPDVDGQIIGQEKALELGTVIFGPLLAAPS